MLERIIEQPCPTLSRPCPENWDNLMFDSLSRPYVIGRDKDKHSRQHLELRLSARDKVQRFLSSSWPNPSASGHTSKQKVIIVATTTNPNTSNRALVPRAINPDDPGPPGSRMRHLVRLTPGWPYAPRLPWPPAVCATSPGLPCRPLGRARTSGLRPGSKGRKGQWPVPGIREVGPGRRLAHRVWVGAYPAPAHRHRPALQTGRSSGLPS